MQLDRLGNFGLTASFAEVEKDTGALVRDRQTTRIHHRDDLSREFLSLAHCPLGKLTECILVCRPGKRCTAHSRHVGRRHLRFNRAKLVGHFSINCLEERHRRRRRTPPFCGCPFDQLRLMRLESDRLCRQQFIAIVIVIEQITVSPEPRLFGHGSVLGLIEAGLRDEGLSARHGSLGLRR